MSKQELRQQLDRTHEAHARRAASGMQSVVADLEIWQKQRLLNTYADIAAQPRFQRAVTFFIDDLYAPPDVPQRDADLERMYPSMVRLLPDSVLSTVAAALELQALSLELDLVTAKVLRSHHVHILSMGAEAYSHAYRELDNRTDRERQIDLIARVGRDLDHYVRNPVIYTTLKMTRIPARVAGMGSIQTFLERGFTAFRSIGGASDFVDIVEQRERCILELLMDGKVAKAAKWLEA